MGFIQAIRSGFRGYFVFSGRSPRSAFWYFLLFQITGFLVTGFAEAVILHGTDRKFGAPLVFLVLTYMPGVSVCVRRLHDIGRSGWWWWFFRVPVMGTIAWIVWMCTKGDAGANRYGPSPLAPSPAAASGRDEPFVEPTGEQ